MSLAPAPGSATPLLARSVIVAPPDAGADVDVPTSPQAAGLEEKLERAIALVRPRLLACYRAGIAKSPQMSGRVTFAITTGDDGKVITLVPEENTGVGASTVACITPYLKEVQYPEPGKRVLLPLNFWLPTPYDDPGVGIRRDPGY